MATTTTTPQPGQTITVPWGPDRGTTVTVRRCSTTLRMLAPGTFEAETRLFYRRADGSNGNITGWTDRFASIETTEATR